MFSSRFQRDPLQSGIDLNPPSLPRWRYYKLTKSPACYLTAQPESEAQHPHGQALVKHTACIVIPPDPREQRHLASVSCQETVSVLPFFFGGGGIAGRHLDPATTSAKWCSPGDGGTGSSPCPKRRSASSVRCLPVAHFYSSDSHLANLWNN